MSHLKGSIGKLGKTSFSQEELFKIEMDHEELFKDRSEDLRDEWVRYFKDGIMSSAPLCKIHNK